MARRPLLGRVARLERGGRAGCPACGHGGREQRYEVVVPEAVGRVSPRAEPPEPRRCGLCGRPAEVFVRFPGARGPA